MKINNYQAVVLPHRKPNPFRILGRTNHPLWEALKFLLILLLILLIATPQLVLAVLLLIIIGALMEAIRCLTAQTVRRT